ncbi:hypothetical protein DL98DRAFT_473099 [Cadophora sp. DSE1049]|nr:hypothetical protein DL98DRAFT_473099 [Cadophora sp. DSE1049]
MQKLLVANMHLTSGLTDKAIKEKKSQIDALSDFLIMRSKKIGTSERENPSEIIIAGDFNLTTSNRTIQKALSRGLITAETATAVKNVIDLSLWEDAFLVSELNPGNGIEDEDQGDGDAGNENGNAMFGHDGNEIFAGEQGATFDRSTNPIAAQLNPLIDRSPQRYDRVLFLKGGGISAKGDGFEIFGFADEEGACGSDHYGVRALLKVTDAGPGAGAGTSESDHRSLLREETTKGGTRMAVVEDDTDFSNLVEPYLPTANDIAQREMAIELLQSTLSHGTGFETLILAPLGSYLMGTYFADSDVDVLAIGCVSPAKFFDFTARELRNLDSREGGSDEGRGFKGVHFVNSLVSIVEVNVLEIKFDLQYCQAEELVRAYHSTIPSPNLQNLVFDKDLISTLSPSSIRPLNTYRDSAYLLNTIPHLPSYRLAHRYLSLYLKNRGLYSAKFGYLGGIHLQLMLNRVVKLIHLSTTEDYSENDSISVSAATIIRTFFAYYASFNWSSENVTDPLLGPDNKVSPRSARDAIFIPAIHTPTARPNVASSCTKLSAHTLSSEFKLAQSHLAAGDWPWCLRPSEEGLQDFMQGSGAFVRVGIDLWGVGESNEGGRGGSGIGEEKVREMIGALESRFPRLLVSLGRIVGVEGRVWPGRLFVPDLASKSQPESKAKGKEIDEEKTREDAEEGQFKGYYLLGVSAREGMDKEGKRLMEGKLMTAVREFERGVVEAREFVEGSRNVWVVVDVVRRKEVFGMGLEIDRREWGGKKRESLISAELGTSIAPFSVPASSAATQHTSSTTQTPSISKPSKQPKHKPTPLRPAHEIIARIKWDADLDIANYLIGYEDRFVGVKEMELGRWKSESTDEEFIPLHRVVWIRLKDDGGAIMWDRRRKIDCFFGSGVGAS